jgi:hypothetical protein
MLLQGTAPSMMLHTSSHTLQKQRHTAGQQRTVLPACRSRSSRAVRVAATATAPAPAPAATADFTAQIVADEAQYVLQTYGRPADIVFVKGEGSKLYDANGKEYLDMAAGGARRTQLGQRQLLPTLLDIAHGGGLWQGSWFSGAVFLQGFLLPCCHSTVVVARETRHPVPALHHCYCLGWLAGKVCGWLPANVALSYWLLLAGSKLLTFSLCCPLRHCVQALP